MNSSCPMVAFDQGPSHIPWTIRESKLSFWTTVITTLYTNHAYSTHSTACSDIPDTQLGRGKLMHLNSPDNNLVQP